MEIETIDKEPEIGDLVKYKYRGDGREVGLVMQTYDQGFDGDDLQTAHIIWGTNDEEDELFSDLLVVSSGDLIYNA
tara:strand:- start:63 stop:290 length:228 start_codon:yes stop_codon:yes gene_type:complete